MANVPTKTTAPATPRPAYAIFGTDAFLTSRKLEALLCHLLGGDRDGTSLSKYEGDSAALADVLDDCRTPSLLAASRVVCVDDADKFVSEHRKSLEKFLQDIIEAPAKARKKDLPPPPPMPGTLVLVCRSWAKTTKLYKLVAKIGRNIECKPPKYRNGFVPWITDHAVQEHRCRMQSGAADRLYELVGDDLGLLNMELAKLATYVAPRGEIRLADVEALIGSSRVEKVFGITDAIGRRDPKTALALWEQVLSTDDKAEHRSIGGLRFGFVKLAEAKRMISQGATLADAQSKLRIWGDARSLKRQLERFSLTQWRGHLVKLLRIDHGAKTSMDTVETSVEKFIVELCAAS